MNLRPATMADEVLLHWWANDPDVRAASFNTGLIDQATHHDWLQQRLPLGGFYIAETKGAQLGYARVDVTGTTGEIAVAVDEELRGHGYGRQIIAAAAKRASQEFGLTEIRARVKAANIASLRAFTEAGFTLTWRP